MATTFNPQYTITSEIMNNLARIEAAKTEVALLPLHPTVLASLRETARLQTTHYSTLIEGNNLSVNQIEQVLKHEKHFSGKERDQQEVKGYYAALAQVERWGRSTVPVTQVQLQTIHALVMAGGTTKVAPTPYRTGQNVIKNSKTGAIIYLPPQADDVPTLMTEFIAWIGVSRTLPCPILAAIAHYQFATIHPYYDGNGRTARLLTTLLLHQGKYDLKGLYSLEEYYAQNLASYYDAISIGESHNYYLGRAQADITGWIDYFIRGMAEAFEKVKRSMEQARKQQLPDRSEPLRKLNPIQREVLTLFQKFETVSTAQVAHHIKLRPRSAAKLCTQWVAEGFLEIANPSKKNRTYRLTQEYEKLMTK